MPLVTRSGFAPLDDVEFVTFSDGAEAKALDLPNDADPAALIARLDEIDLIRIPFPTSHDGRGFSLARRLRALGYTGRLRAAGALISDQFRYALDCGFDEVEIDDTSAARQPEANWLPRPAPSYRERLAGRV